MSNNTCSECDQPAVKQNPINKERRLCADCYERLFWFIQKPKKVIVSYCDGYSVKLKGC